MVKKQKPKPTALASELVPPWLEVMRAITGLSEESNGSNPRIEGMAAYIGRKFPPQADYAAQYTSDDIAWCGVATAFCLAAATPDGISGPFGPTDTDRWMWAQSFANDPGFIHQGSPVPGTIVVMSREGGGHVTMFEEWDDGELLCRGGNQSNEVNVSSYDPGTVIAYCWPKDVPAPPTPPAERKDLEEGDVGPQVVEVQTILGVYPTDGDFGAITDGAVKGYQAACSITADGCVGPQTWARLDALEAAVAAGSDGLSPTLTAAITDVATLSEIARYSWNERGPSPIGFTVGIALCFALALDRLNAEDDAALAMAEPNHDDPDDVFWWYQREFDDEDMDNSENVQPEDRLRHLFALMLGLGPWESSGRYCEGRDQSASNTSADEAEAGMFQTSWNIRSCHDAIPPLLTEYWRNPCGFREKFQDGVSLKPDDLGNFGSGPGAQYQFLSKYAPAFHAFVTAIGLRNLGGEEGHWGPIRRKDVEVRSEADDMLQAVQDLMTGSIEPPEPEPGPGPEPGQPWVSVQSSWPVTVKYDGDVYVTVNGVPLRG